MALLEPGEAAAAAFMPNEVRNLSETSRCTTPAMTSITSDRLRQFETKARARPLGPLDLWTVGSHI